MITKETIEKVLKYSLDLNQWFILSCIKNGEDISSLFTIKKILGWKTLLHKKGYLEEDGSLSQMGKYLLDNIDSDAPLLKVTVKDLATGPVAPAGSRAVFREWVKELHGKLQREIMRVTGGKKQKYLTIGKNRYAFLDGPLDLENKLTACMKRYGIKDLAKIEKLLIRHCSQESPLIKYYIMKENTSPLATDYDNYDEVIADDKQKEETQPSSGAVDI